VISNHKLIAFWEEKFNEIELLDESNYNNKQGIILIESPFTEITLSDGFWKNINNKFNKMFDFAEEEDIEVEIMPELIEEINNYSKEHYRNDGICEVVIGEQVEPEQKILKAKISYKDLREYINLLCNFLNDAKEKNKNVIMML
jgi:hypothetical protein